MANNDTMKDALAGKVDAVTVDKTGTVLEPVADIQWTSDEKAAIRAIALAMSTSRKPVTTDDVVKELRKALATKAKTTFYTPFETDWKAAERVATRSKSHTNVTLTKYLHQNVQASGWLHMTNLGCKLDVVPPKSNEEKLAEKLAIDSAVNALVEASKAEKAEPKAK